MPVSIGDITEAFEFANTGGNMGRISRLRLQAGWENLLSNRFSRRSRDERRTAGRHQRNDGGEKTSRSRTNVSSGWASRWCWILLASSCRTISTTSAISSAGGAPTRNSRPCSPDEVRSITGTSSKRESHGADVARLVRAAFDRNCRLNWRAGADEDGRHCLVVAP